MKHQSLYTKINTLLEEIDQTLSWVRELNNPDLDELQMHLEAAEWSLQEAEEELRFNE